MKTKQIDQLKRARTGLRGWMTRDFDAVLDMMESDSPEVSRVEEKLDSIVARLQKAEDLQIEIEKLMNDDDQVRAEVNAQGPGDVLDWAEFWDIFSVAVHDNPEIPPVQKFVYLKSLLTGEAAGYVANIKTEQANYDVAVQRLQSRYGKDEVQRNRLMTKLADMKPLEQSNKAMRDAVDELCATVRALQVQGVTPEQYGALLMPLIESKLPKDWRLEWAREKAGLAKDDVTFSKLLKFLERELEIRESADQLDEKSQSVFHLDSSLW